MKRLLSTFAALLMIGGLSVVAPASAQAAPYCGIRWGSTAKTLTDPSYGEVQDLRSGRHACFDRLVIDLDHDAAGYVVRYDPVNALGTGDVIPLRGGADVEILVEAPAYDVEGLPTYQPSDPSEAVDVAGYRTFRQVVWGSSYEGQSLVGLGVRARLPMRVFVLDGPGEGARLVVDVAHRW